ncbi:MAG: NUDIX domain-containing protein [Friedmanniella sp.]
MITGDGWTTCAAGHRHWGLFGAAGLLLQSDLAAEPAVGLQLRARWSHHGGTWGLLGGARGADESAVDAALREASEEASLTPDQVRVEASYLDDHGGWGYTTVVASAVAPIALAPRSAESDAVRWVPLAKVDALPLHPGFARTWPLLRTVQPTPVVVVDGANVMGSRPDGWWRDRAGAARRLRDQLAALAARGVEGAALGPAVPGLRLYPRFVLVVEGAARGLPPVGAVEVLSASGSGDDALVELVAARAAEWPAVAVVTADRELGRRVGGLGADVLGPRTLLDLL